MSHIKDSCMTTSDVRVPSRDAVMRIIEAEGYMNDVADALVTADHARALEAIRLAEQALERAKEAIKDARDQKTQLARRN